MEHRGAERVRARKRMRCPKPEMTQTEIVVSAHSTNTGISDGHLTGLAPRTAQERERRRVEDELMARIHFLSLMRWSQGHSKTAIG